MRKLIFALLPALAFAASARTLTPEEALTRVQTNPTLRKVVGKQTAQPMLKATVNTSEGDPAVYLYHSADQYLLLSASDVAEPLLGYCSAAPEGEEMPPQMKAWLDSYAAAIQYAENAPKPDFYSAIKAPEKEYIKPLLATTWDQLGPYNKYTPGGSPTGCVATAIAQVMKHHNYPASTTGEGIAYYKGTRYTRSLNATYNWDVMTNSYNAGSTDAEINAVATLMVNAGYAAKMFYDNSVSGTNDQAMINAMVNVFKYSPACWMRSRDHYPIEEWEDMLYNELVNNRPVYYSGMSSSGGHAFVCDGYEKGYFHINWGWSGYCDGWFKIDALNPAGQGTGGYAGGYNIGQTALFNCAKPKAGDVRPQVQLTMFDLIKATTSGTTLKLESQWFNYTYIGTKLTIELSLRNMETKQEYREVIYDGVDMGSGQGFNTIPASLTKIPDGVYEVQVVSRENGYSEWLPTLHNQNHPAIITVTKTNGKLIVTGAAEKEPEYTNLRPNGEINKDEVASYSMTITNYSQKPLSQKIAVGLMDQTDKGYSLVASTSNLYHKTATVSETSSLDVTYNFKLEQFSSDFKFNTTQYFLAAYDPDNMKILTVYDKQVSVNSSTGVVEITKADVKTPIVLRDEYVQYSVTISNSNASAQSMKTALAITNFDGELVALTEGESNTVAAKTTKTFTHNASFSFIEKKFIVNNGEYVANVVAPSDYKNVLLKVGVVKIDTTSDIDTLQNADTQARYVDLLGRPVSNPKRGLYIRTDRPAKVRF